jgi:glutamyl-Q tRNA(Asp) synthetase
MERFGAYRGALERLTAMELTYPCFCTRKEIQGEIARAGDAPSGPEGHLYPGTCRGLDEAIRAMRIARGEAYALRLDAAQAAARVGALTFVEQGAGPNGEHGVVAVDPLLFGDFVLSRKDTPASYHLAVVLDDALQGVTLVTRGCDLHAAAHIQRVLQALLDLPEPAYAHHRLVLDANGKKFSKRDPSVTLRDLRANGVSPDAVRRQLGF